jgi:muconolactone delta-isomerase
MSHLLSPLTGSPRACHPDHAGYVLRLWRRAADGTTIALCRATDETDLRATLDTLPTRKWQTLEITELRPHPSDPALP